jgi:hypothetical protein
MGSILYVSQYQVILDCNVSALIILTTLSPGIRRMGPGSEASILELAAFDKAEPSWRAPPKRGMSHRHTDYCHYFEFRRQMHFVQISSFL